MIRHKKQRGQALVEFAFVLPVFLVFVVLGMVLVWAVGAWGSVAYVAQQVANCRANWWAGGSTSAYSQCADPNAYGNTLATSMPFLIGGGGVTVTETQGVPCATCVQEQVSYVFLTSTYSGQVPSLLPGAVFSNLPMSQQAAAAATMFSGTITVPLGTINGNDCLLPAAPNATGLIANVQPGMVAIANPAPGSPYQDQHIVWYAYVDPNTPGQVDLNVCNVSGNQQLATVTTYSVRVIP